MKAVNKARRDRGRGSNPEDEDGRWRLRPEKYNYEKTKSSREVKPVNRTIMSVAYNIKTHNSFAKCTKSATNP